MNEGGYVQDPTAPRWQSWNFHCSAVSATSPTEPNLESSEPGPRVTNKARGPARLEVKCSLRWTPSLALPRTAAVPGPSTAHRAFCAFQVWWKQGPGSGSLRHSGHTHVTDCGSLTLIYLCFLMAIARRAASEAGQFLRSATDDRRGAAECCSGRTGSAALQIPA